MAMGVSGRFGQALFCVDKSTIWASGWVVAIAPPLYHPPATRMSEPENVLRIL
jgi:hypothetical protein